MAPQAPPPSSPVFDSRTQIIDNCEFLISKDDIVQVIISKDPADKLFKAHAVKCNEDTREPILVSEPCENAQKAVESLHAKSCEAVHNYITTNGFSPPRDLKMALQGSNLDDDDDDNDNVSFMSDHSDSSTAALSEWGSSGDETMMLHDASGPNEAPKQGQHAPFLPEKRAEPWGTNEPWKEPPRARLAGPTRSRSPSLPIGQVPPPPPPGYPGPPKSDGPPAPPPSIRGIPVHAYPARMPGPYPLRPQNGVKPPPPMPLPQPLTRFRLPAHLINRAPLPGTQGTNREFVSPHFSASNGASNGASIKRGEYIGSCFRPGTVFHPNADTFTVGLTVRWVGHGQHRIISSVHPDLEALHQVAMADVRLHPEKFTGEGPSAKGAAGPSKKDGDRPSGLVAHVSTIMLAGEKYDVQALRGYNLTTLFEALASDGMPSFEVVVNDVPNDVASKVPNNVPCGCDGDDDEASFRGVPSPRKSDAWD